MSSRKWQELYPFESSWFTTGEGHRLHYIDTGGDGVPAVMLHGNPTWSFMYRDLARKLAECGGRAIALDNLGGGLSDKPQKWDYRLAGHKRNLQEFIDGVLGDREFDLVVHDWGGVIGLAYAVEHPERIRRLVLMNTTAFMLHGCPRIVALADCPLLGSLLVRGLNLFVNGALRLAAAKPLSAAVKAGYRHPYGSWHDRIATQRYVQDIPARPDHPSWEAFHSIKDKLGCLACKPILLCWGEKDFCVGMEFYRHWQTIYPEARAISFPDASHYLLEDNPDEIIPEITGFLAN
ncbi:MAG: alpha/beta fold hydrolase [Victivallales bacterium]|nr:alpha/beta fold hydrolase [Victivallales bacterium]